ncbi:hypothetical protein CMQ_5230 [Grosmannia clavigera kw1407]|uniref:Diacylglycerol O-acyltransferase n=1 Tax=Grosmannia clavigera (strain kw1407 / UAMH 11150) TaxID=655863 RepID=F0XB58_GROCL|nr:uncharacterized protein CMQ_5230 [Grosmannia clavigera kw1407]EFX04968.1 hypothetical protein CMQ_5230 [Grosmannia clavigera kw1407]
MHQPDKEDQLWSSEYTVRGESNYLHRMYYFLHRFGLQSNIICSARYKSDERDAIIDRSKLYAVLKSIIDQYPELAIVGVMESSPKPGRYRLRRALLHRIHLHTCTEFIETQDGVSPDLLERLHGEWLWTAAKPDKPWWKVVVVNGQDVVFVFHHFVCDGRFGYLFHKAFAEALNAMPRPSASPAPMTDTVEVDAAKAPHCNNAG